MGHATAAGTDSVRPLSQPGFSKFQSARMRPGTVGKATGRKGNNKNAMRSSFQNSVNVPADDLLLTTDHVALGMMGRNKLNTASA